MNNVCRTSLVQTNAIELDGRVVFTKIRAVGVGVTGPACSGNIFIVCFPGQSLLFEQVKNRRLVGGYIIVVVICDTKIGTRDGGDIVGLGGVCDPIVIGQDDSMLSDRLILREINDIVKVLIGITL